MLKISDKKNPQIERIIKETRKIAQLKKEYRDYAEYKKKFMKIYGNRERSK